MESSNNVKNQVTAIISGFFFFWDFFFGARLFFTFKFFSFIL